VPTDFGTLKTTVSVAIEDPSNLTFSTTVVGTFINAALSELSRIAPDYFQEDITPVADTLEYIVLSSVFGGVPQPDIEVARIELWDYVPVPPTRLYVVPRARATFAADSQGGWSNWGGTIYLPRRVWNIFDGHEADYLLRVWGYGPYPQLVADEDTTSASAEVLHALVAYCRVEVLNRLLSSRELFSQWQTRSGNADISPAGLMNSLTVAQADWKRRSGQLWRPRGQI
jgi:hypothetical protein